MKTKEEIAAKRKLWYEANKEKYKGRKNQISKEWRENNKERMKELEKNWRENNTERKQLNAKIYREKNKEKLNNNAKQWRENNRQLSREYVKKWGAANKAKRNENERLRRQNDPLYRLKSNIRQAIYKTIKNKGYKKSSKTEQILGCTFQQFKEHLESQFEPWMNWDNYGNWNGVPTEPNTAWDIDHHIPVSTAITEEDIIKLNHYTNLKPLCGFNNRYVKSNNI